MPDATPNVTALHLRHPDLVFHVDVKPPEHEGRWLTTVTLADQPDMGTGDDPQEALGAALGEPFASELARHAELAAPLSSPLAEP